MAATIENLDDLTNDALRLRLLEYGFANLPVTLTTRNVLIKKLRNAMEANKAKTRRETVSVARYSSEESESDTEAKKPAKAAANRRATIAAVASKKEQRPIAKPTIRRSGRTTPSAITSQPVVALAEHSDEEVVLPASQPPPSQTASQRNKSRSPSMGKSAVLTTSYKQLIHTPVAEVEEYNEDDDDVIILDDENGESSYDEELPPPRSAFSGKSAKQSSLFTTKTTTTTNSRTLSGGSGGLSAADHLRRLTVGGAAIGNAAVSNATFRSSSPKVASLFGNYDAATGPLHANTAYKRRYTTNASAISSTTSPHYTNGNDEDDLLAKHSTPFLSDFTRRLAELKTLPLGGEGALARGGSPSSTSATLSYRTSGDHYRTSSGRRSSSLAQRGGQKADSTVFNTFVDFLRACERNIRLPLLVLLVVLAAVFVYVMLYQ